MPVGCWNTQPARNRRAQARRFLLSMRSPGDRVEILRERLASCRHEQIAIARSAGDQAARAHGAELARAAPLGRDAGLELELANGKRPIGEAELLELGDQCYVIE